MTPLPAPGDARLRRGARGRARRARARARSRRSSSPAAWRRASAASSRPCSTAVDGKSFLEAKLVQTRALEQRARRASVPVALMTSFATDDAIRAHVAERDLGDPLVFNQFVSLRLETVGRALPRRRAAGRRCTRPGTATSSRRSGGPGTLDALRERGVRVVTVSNVDNLGARVDPVVVGAHLLGGRPLTCEVARKEGDMGGAPVRVDGKLQLVEGPRFPPSFDQELAPVFNTNTALVRPRRARRATTTSRWLYVRKAVDGRDAVQLERLYHEVSAFVPTQYLEVPRRGPRGRFSADQDAGRPRARAGRPARARLGVARSDRERTDTHSARVVTRRGRTVGRCVCSISCCPERCAICEAPGAALCARCADPLTRLGPPVCERCGSPGPWPVRRCAECSGRRLAFARGALGDRLRRAARGRSSARGRSVGGVGSRVRRRRSSPRSSRGRRSTRSSPCPGDPERAWERGDVPARALATELAADLGASRSLDVLAATRSASSPARALARRASPQRARQRRRPWPRCRAERLRRRRRLHVGRDRRRVRAGVPDVPARVVVEVVTFARAVR